MGGNIDRLGLWEQPRDWADWFYNPPKKGLSTPAPVKDCPSCQAIINASSAVCPYCSHKFVPKIKDPISGKLVEVPSLIKSLAQRKVNDLSVHELIQLQALKNYKNGFILRILRTKPNAPELIAQFAKLKGYKPSWAYHQLKGEKNYTNFTIK
jgi:TusA-related sulfurtransferase/DNA-directed RNA polymerase subunit RPC12/RpoP